MEYQRKVQQRIGHRISTDTFSNNFFFELYIVTLHDSTSRHYNIPFTMSPHPPFERLVFFQTSIFHLRPTFSHSRGCKLINQDPRSPRHPSCCRSENRITHSILVPPRSTLLLPRHIISDTCSPHLTFDRSLSRPLSYFPLLPLRHDTPCIKRRFTTFTKLHDLLLASIHLALSGGHNSIYSVLLPPIITLSVRRSIIDLSPPSIVLALYYITCVSSQMLYIILPRKRI